MAMVCIAAVSGVELVSEAHGKHPEHEDGPFATLFRLQESLRVLKRVEIASGALVGQDLALQPTGLRLPGGHLLLSAGFV